MRRLNFRSLICKRRMALLSSIILLLMVFYSKPLFSQAFTGGVLGGITASQIDGDRYSGFHKLGLTGGFYVARQLDDNWQLQTEIKFSGRGARWNTGSKEIPDYYQLSLNYVELPLVASYILTDQFFVEGGLAYSLLLDLNYFNNGDKLADDLFYTASNTSAKYKNADINGIIGLGYQPQAKMSIHLRYAYSMIPARKRNTGYYYGYLVDALGLESGDFNNFLSIALYYQLSE